MNKVSDRPTQVSEKSFPGAAEQGTKATNGTVIPSPTIAHQLLPSNLIAAQIPNIGFTRRMAGSGSHRKIIGRLARRAGRVSADPAHLLVSRHITPSG